MTCRSPFLGACPRNSDIADRRLDAGIGEPRAVFNRDVLGAAVGIRRYAARRRPNRRRPGDFEDLCLQVETQANAEGVERFLHPRVRSIA